MNKLPSTLFALLLGYTSFAFSQTITNGSGNTTSSPNNTTGPSTSVGTPMPVIPGNLSNTNCTNAATGSSAISNNSYGSSNLNCDTSSGSNGIGTSNSGNPGLIGPSPSDPSPSTSTIPGPANTVNQNNNRINSQYGSGSATMPSNPAPSSNVRVVPGSSSSTVAPGTSH